MAERVYLPRLPRYKLCRNYAGLFSSGLRMDGIAQSES
jgi:hypothetical protein